MTPDNVPNSTSEDHPVGEDPSILSSIPSVVDNREEHRVGASATDSAPSPGASGDRDDKTGSDGGRRDDESGSESEEGEGVVGNLVHAQRRSKTRAERALRKGGKAGNQGRFKPVIEDFLNGYVDVYAVAHKSAGGRAKGLDEFWHLVRSEFWEKFDWKDARVGMPSNGEGLKQEDVMTRTNEVRVICRYASQRLTCISH